MKLCAISQRLESGGNCSACRSGSRSAHPTEQGEAHLANQEQAFPGAAELCKRMDGRGTRGSRGALCRRTCSRLSRNDQNSTQALCRTAATVPERDGGLLGERDGRSALLCRQPSRRPGIAAGHGTRSDSAARKGCAEPTQPTTTRGRSEPSSLHRGVRPGRVQSDLSGRDEEEAHCLQSDLSASIPARIGPGKNSSPLPSALASGQETTMQLAERGTRLSDPAVAARDPQAEALERLARPRFSATDYQTSAGRLAPAMFTPGWSQENFFRYMHGKATVWIALWTIGPRLFLRRRGCRPKSGLSGTRWQGSAKRSPASAAETRNSAP